MSNTHIQAPLRFVHSSDWRLERPLFGLAEIPEHLRELLRDAPYLAAEQVVETALTENADALLLAGDILDVEQAGPRAVVFLLEQFKRLEARGIRVFWAGGLSDRPDTWPPSTPLPENVTVFPVGRVETHNLERDGKVVARVQGASRGEGRPIDSSGFHADAHGRYTVGVACGTSDSAGKEGDRVDYMALGGRARRKTVDVDPGIAHYCGTQQGRSPAETGPAGCTVVQVDAERKTTTRFVSTDAVRWAHETLEFTAGATEDDLRSRLRDRLEKLRAKARDVDQLVAWNLVGAGPLLVRLRPGGLCDELLAELQKFDGRQSPACWSYRVACDQACEPPAEWLDQETILGDLLRQIAVFRKSDAFVLDLGDMLPKPLPEKQLAAVAKIGDADAKARLFDAVEKLGVALMTEE